MTERPEVVCKTIERGSEGYERVSLCIEFMRTKILDETGFRLGEPRISELQDKSINAYWHTAHYELLLNIGVTGRALYFGIFGETEIKGELKWQNSRE